MITLLAPRNTGTPSGGYIYNDRVSRCMPDKLWTYLLLPMPNSKPPSVHDLCNNRVVPNTHILLDSLFFSFSAWVQELYKHHKRPISILAHYLPSLNPLLTEKEVEILRTNERTCLQCCRTVITPSVYLQKKLQEIGPENLSILVATPGIQKNTTENCPGEVPHAGVYSAQGVKAEIRLLTIAHWTPSKNHRYLLPILGSLKYLPWTWEIYGAHDPGEKLVDAFSRQAAKLGLSQKIHVGTALPHDRIQTAMKEADIFLYPSLFESYGMVVAEALTAGLPVVASRVGGIPEVVGTPPAALLCEIEKDEESARQWKESISRLVNSPEEQKKYAHAAYSRAYTLPDWKETAKKILSYLETQ